MQGLVVNWGLVCAAVNAGLSCKLGAGVCCSECGMDQGFSVVWLLPCLHMGNSSHLNVFLSLFH